MSKLLFALLFVFLLPDALAQTAPVREFRGAWIATVTNLDWPTSRTASVAAQQAELRNEIEQLHRSGINAIIFQIRTEGDALYASPHEPWSYWLTGQQGRAPNPVWDPLAFVIQEARARGMEVHAWFNPFRMERSVGNYPRDPNHITLQRPEWTITIGTYRMLDPGLQAVRDYTTEIFMDVVRRYDVDAIHIDDYFYPYPPSPITNQDDASFAAEPRGFTNRADWRRDNVNLFVRQVYETLQEVNPRVKFGVSPFGIWRNGVPSGITGLDAFVQIFADATAWLNAQTVDYLVPQLYWDFDGGQDYARLAPWWASVRNERHLYMGLGLYKSDSRTFSGGQFGSRVIPRQIRFNRSQEGIEGSVLFRSSNVAKFNSRGITDTLRTDLFRSPALLPSMAWKDQSVPGVPSDVAQTLLEGQVGLGWQAGVGEIEPRWFAVYVVPESLTFQEAQERGGFVRAIVPAESPQFSCTYDGQGDACARSSGRYTVYLTALSYNWIESAPVEAATFVAIGTSTTQEGGVSGFHLGAPWPNPARTQVEFEVYHDVPATLLATAYDALGRAVYRSVQEVQAGGTAFTVPLTALSGGHYLLVVHGPNGVQRVSFFVVP